MVGGYKMCGTKALDIHLPASLAHRVFTFAPLHPYTKT